MGNPAHPFKTPAAEQRSAASAKYDEWYGELKNAPGRCLDIHGSDLTSELVDALRRRARRDGLGLSLGRYSGESHPVSLFEKNERGPGRLKYLAAMAPNGQEIYRAWQVLEDAALRAAKLIKPQVLAYLAEHASPETWFRDVMLKAAKRKGVTVEYSTRTSGGVTHEVKRLKVRRGGKG